MIEVMIERWVNRDGGQDYLWSVWRDGSRVHMGGPHPTAEAAETEAREYCIEELGVTAERVTRL
ncbi:MAG: hypothetical protein ACE5JZ_11800 [Kiloniellales bacterium]